MGKVIFFIVFITAGIGITYYYLQPKEQPLPIINPVDVEEEMVDPSLLRKGYGHVIGDFSFLDQNGKPFSRKHVQGKVFVVEYFFTTCGTICPKMNSQLQRVQRAFQTEPDLEILSFTVNPEIDTVEQMKRYAEAHGAMDDQWHFLTGSKVELYKLARTSFFVLKPAEAQNLGDAGGDFIHTNNFVLCGRGGRIRGYYDGTDPQSVDEMMEDIEKLLEEEEP